MESEESSDHKNNVAIHREKVNTKNSKVEYFKNLFFANNFLYILVVMKVTLNRDSVSSLPPNQDDCGVIFLCQESFVFSFSLPVQII